MSYADIRAQADSAPLADALTKIAETTTASESDPELMLEMLNNIEEIISSARTAFMANVRKAQDDELQRLRALAAES